MKNRNGVTLITLVVTVIIIGILIGITGVTSIQTYKQMKFENFKTELEEIQKKVDEICEDYKIFKKEVGTDTTYLEYFASRYNYAPSMFFSSNKSKVKDLIKEHDEFLDHDGFVFYFDEESLNEFLGLKGIEQEILIDFSTRYVYSIKGIEDPSEKRKNLLYCKRLW